MLSVAVLMSGGSKIPRYVTAIAAATSWEVHESVSQLEQYCEVFQLAGQDNAEDQLVKIYVGAAKRHPFDAPCC